MHRYLLTLIIMFIMAAPSWGAAKITAAFDTLRDAEGATVNAGKSGTNTLEVVGATVGKMGGKPTMLISGPWADVRSFGAVADTGTDQSGYINAALATGKDILIPPGVWTINSRIRPTVNGQRILAMNGSVVRLMASVVQGTKAIDCTGLNDIEVVGLEIDGNYPTNDENLWNSAGVLFQSSTGGKVINCNIKNFRSSLNDAKGVWVLDADKTKVIGGSITNSNNNYIVQKGSYNDITSTLLEDNYLSEAYSVYTGTPSTDPSLHNTFSNLTIRNVNVAINIQGAMYTAGTTFTIENCLGAIQLGGGGNSITNGTIKYGSRTTGVYAGIQTLPLDPEGNAPLIQSTVSNVIIDVAGRPARGISVTGGVDNGTPNFTFTEVSVTDSTRTQGDTSPGWFFENAKNIIVQGGGASYLGSQSFFFANASGLDADKSRKIRLIDVSANSAKYHNIFVAVNAVDGLVIDSGEIKNGNQAGGTYAGLAISTGNANITNTARVFDDQAIPTQTTGIYDPGNAITAGTLVPYTGASTTVDLNNKILRNVNNLSIGATANPHPFYMLSVDPTMRVESSSVNATLKQNRLVLGNYINANPDFWEIGGISSSTNNSVYIGGSNASYAAATDISFYTGADINTTTGTRQLLIDKPGNGITFYDVQRSAHHVNVNGGTPPALSACGTSPAIASGSNDHAGRFIIGATGTGCTATFNVAYTNIPSCVVTSQTSNNITSYTSSASALTVVGGPGTYDYICTGLGE